MSGNDTIALLMFMFAIHCLLVYYLVKLVVYGKPPIECTEAELQDRLASMHDKITAEINGRGE